MEGQESLADEHYSSPAEGNFCDEQGNAVKSFIIVEYNCYVCYVDQRDRVINCCISCLIWTVLRIVLLLCFRHLFNSLGMLDAMFLSDRQQDATEFLLCLLDLFREQFSSAKSDIGLQGWCFMVCQVLLVESLLESQEGDG